MTRISVFLAVGIAAWACPVHAGWLTRGVGKYGPYTGGHGYSYNVAYSYGFAWSAADTWNRDIFAYPAGINPYRPYGKPIRYRVFPIPDTPYVSVPGPNDLPTLIRPVPPAEMAIHEGAMVVPHVPTMPSLQPVPQRDLTPLPAPVPVTSATIRVQVPEGAQVWVEKEKVEQTGSERVFQTPPLSPGKMQIYSVRAQWSEGGKLVEQYRVVGVRAGETARLTFPSAP